MILAALLALAAAAAPLDCEQQPCDVVLPGAARFEAVPDKPWLQGVDEAGQAVGWVVRSTDISRQVGYSAQPMVTLVGVDPEGRIAGALLVAHAEPIMLVGIPDSALDEFVEAHVGRHVGDPISVGGRGEHDIDAVSGATVTVLAQQATILESARAVATDMGLISASALAPGRFVEDEPWTWRRMVRQRSLGHLVVQPEDMGLPPAEQPFVDVWFGIVDAPQLGIPLLGEANWRYHTGRLQEGEHLLIMLNSGSASVKGSGFVRGGIFDRMRLEQGLRTIIFRDLDHTRLDPPRLDGAPPIWEAALFVARDGALDPGAPYTFVFLGSAWDGRSAFQRDFHTFKATHRLPRSVYRLDGVAPEDVVWRTAWARGWPKALATGLFFLALGGLFVARAFLTGRMRRLQRLHTGFMVVAFLGLGVGLAVQPSITQLLTIVASLFSGWDWRLFLSDPVLWVSWFAIALFIVLWGRGVFCGWACAYGAMNELTFKLGRRLRLPELELPDWIHLRARYLRYGILAVLLATFLADPILGEKLAEVEPFKSTFFVPFWTRHPLFVAWWVALFAWSLVTYRPFCRYLCPLGAALAVPSAVRLSSPYRRDFCSKCRICTRGCEPRAIRPDGTIDATECLNCMECEANWRDDQVCPPLVKARRDRERAPGGGTA